MKRITKYLVTNLFQTTLYSLLALVMLYSIFELLLEGTNLFKASNEFSSALQYIFIRIPVYVYEMAPIAVLAGSIIALTRLVVSNEYVVIRSSGISLFKISIILIVFGFFMGGFTALLGEFVVPPAEKISDQIKSKTELDNISMVGKYNIWLKLDDEIIELWEVLPDFTFTNVLKYKVIDNKKLSYIQYAEKAEYQGNNTWQLKNIYTTTFQEDSIESNYAPLEKWQPKLSLVLLDILVNKPKNMSISRLVEYIKHLNNNHQKTSDYEIELWKKVFFPFSMIVMVLIGLAFTPIIGRYTNIGVEITLGLFVGVIFFFTIRFFSFFAQLVTLPPIWFAVLPSVIFITIISLVLFYKERY